VPLTNKLGHARADRHRMRRFGACIRSSGAVPRFSRSIRAIEGGRREAACMPAHPAELRDPRSGDRYQARGSTPLTNCHLCIHCKPLDVPESGARKRTLHRSAAREGSTLKPRAGHTRRQVAITRRKRQRPSGDRPDRRRHRCRRTEGPGRRAVSKRSNDARAGQPIALAPGPLERTASRPEQRGGGGRTAETAVTARAGRRATPSARAHRTPPRCPS